jgi:hypothetical protein
LLRVMAERPDNDWEVLAGRVGISRAGLDGCRAGEQSLDLHAQSRLATVVLETPELTPREYKLARALLAQTQAAARYAAGEVERHDNYPRVELR